MRSVASVAEMMRMRHHIAVVGKDAPVRLVLQALIEAEVESVLVVDGRQRVVGSIADEQLIAQANVRQSWSWRHLFKERDYEPDGNILDLHAGEVMSRRVVPVMPDLRLASALRLFDHHAVNVLPVITDGDLIGALFRSDLVKHLFSPKTGSTDAPA